MFFIGLPGLYFAIWLSRFSLSMVNAMPYYYGMLMTAVSLFCGMLIGFTMYIPFSDFFRKKTDFQSCNRFIGYFRKSVFCAVML